jgi:C-terminal processing protease CtpA/Prc
MDGLATMKPNQQSDARKSWMIGAVCLPAPEMVRVQLGLEQSTGLLVQKIQPGSPADLAGLKRFDVLLYADDQQLTSVKDLTTVVDDIGQQAGTISLTVMRGGQEVPIEIQPVERDFAAMPMRRMPMNMFEMNDMGPGILFGGRDGGEAGMNRMREMMQRQLDQMKEEFQNMDALIQQGIPMDLPGIPMNQQ